MDLQPAITKLKDMAKELSQLVGYAKTLSDAKAFQRELNSYRQAIETLERWEHLQKLLKQQPEKYNKIISDYFDDEH